ncbi:50S ribosomal protein L21 [Candidatus Microgenomates bacterium]|nr:50S ribosomal protein L21 [Candidatus Microgenomates bacterium]
MLAIIKTGGKQYIVREGQSLDVEKITGEEGSTTTFESVLLVADDKKTDVGAPFVSGAKVEAIIEKQFKDKKVEIQRFKRKTGYRRRIGHRQTLTKIKIGKIIA